MHSLCLLWLWQKPEPRSIRNDDGATDGIFSTVSFKRNLRSFLPSLLGGFFFGFFFFVMASASENFLVTLYIHRLPATTLLDTTRHVRVGPQIYFVNCYGFSPKSICWHSIHCAAFPWHCSVFLRTTANHCTNQLKKLVRFNTFKTITNFLFEVCVCACARARARVCDCTTSCVKVATWWEPLLPCSRVAQTQNLWDEFLKN